MAVDFVEETETHELYCVDGSHMFELDVHAEPHQMREVAGIFSQWAKFMEDVAKIHETGELRELETEEGK